jgi:hypothetical protein
MMLDEGFEPIVIPIKGKHLPDFSRSICASVVRYFAQEDYKSHFLPKTVTEYFWSYKMKQEYLLPGMKEEKDLNTMIKMILPCINDSSIYHELGIGSGEGLLMLIRLAQHQIKTVIGTDINSFSLEIFKILLEEGLKIKNDELFQLRNVNASKPLDEIALAISPCRRLITGANRFFSVLDDVSFQAVIENLKNELKKGDFLAVGITTNSEFNKVEADKFVETGQYILQPMKSELGYFLMLVNPFEQDLKNGIFKSREELIQDIHMETKLPIDKIDISKVVFQGFYDPDKFTDDIKDKIGIKKSPLTENIQQIGQFEKEVKLFQKD